MSVDLGAARLRALLMKHEGLRLHPYMDNVGNLTIGVGRNLGDVGISEHEAMVMLNADIERVTAEAINTFGWFKSLNLARQDVVLSMLFNMGLHRFLEFGKTIQALRDQRYEDAANEMLASKWSGQVGLRAQELATMMRTGQYPS